MIAKAVLQVLLFVFPWAIRRPLLNLFFGYEIAPTAHIGLSVVLPRKLRMAPASWIGHFNICRALTIIDLGEAAAVGHLNWISGTAAGAPGLFPNDPDRHPSLTLHANAAVTSRHHLDCTDAITVGSFTTVAGWGSQMLTHSIDIVSNSQRTGPITIGAYCFTGSRVVVLKNAALPDYSVLAAGSVLNKKQSETYSLYSGCPAEKKRDLDRSSKYFSRTVGPVH